MEIMFWVLFGLIIVAIFLAGIGLPHRNNWLLLTMWIVSAILFANALYQGGGEPLGLNALEQIGKAIPTTPDPVMEQYKQALGNFLPPAPATTPTPPITPTTQLSWFWWKVWFWWTAFAALFIPVAFWDEIADAWRRFWERWEQRPARISLRPPPPPPSPVAPGTTPAGAPTPPPDGGRVSFWRRFRERFFAALSADVIADTIFDLGGNAARRFWRKP